MRAAVITAPGKVELDDSVPGPRGVVIPVAATGLCGTGPHILHGEHAPSLPSPPATSSPERSSRSVPR